jgi:hypothetical protein
LNDLENLKEGEYIRILGFISTSLNRSIVVDKFLDKGCCLIVIEMEEVDFKNEYEKRFDTGFVNFEELGIPTIFP